MEDLNGDYFSLLVDESCDISRKEQMAIWEVLLNVWMNRESQAKKVQVALDMGEVESGKGLNQELGLARAANTRWGSHYKSFKNFISMFGSIMFLILLLLILNLLKKKLRQPGYLKVCQTFEIAFILHLMRDILAITNELNESLQKKEQDIANAILLVKVVKKRLQDLRNEGWDSLIENV
ncbi:hypothetical protein H5410_059971 [Solanum commersonii]|uniref:DUF4371 domain-containing protein n=1 Tax=Solanum commersonii TaxID=4109 RepID=A0A9J5W3V2_SOLCO|nr:hypothetical protein H5410_059971 [Solanum commersonii]